ncbi:hypothetical protein ACFSJY_09150 [Thalassotalea euphylliae]|uniref:hypothetical protein n=1 Tax=Thalassotalea euphylliae TaxID=1655234 RepID=UPI003632C961
MATASKDGDVTANFKFIVTIAVSSLIGAAITAVVLSEVFDSKLQSQSERIQKLTDLLAQGAENTTTSSWNIASNIPKASSKQDVKLDKFLQNIETKINDIEVATSIVKQDVERLRRMGKSEAQYLEVVVRETKGKDSALLVSNLDNREDICDAIDTDDWESLSHILPNPIPSQRMKCEGISILVYAIQSERLKAATIISKHSLIADLKEAESAAFSYPYLHGIIQQRIMSFSTPTHTTEEN